MKQTLRALLFSSFVGAIFLTALAQVPPPTNLTATRYSGPLAVIAVQLNWLSPPLAGPLIKFNIYRKDGGLNEPGTFVKKYQNVQMTQIMDAQVQAGATYSYYVTTVTPAGESNPSNMVQITLNNNLQNGIIAGRVTNDVTNSPIGGARVHLIPAAATPGTVNSGFVFLTNNLGEFRAVLPPATYIMKTSADGFVSEFYDNVSDPQQATPIILGNQDSIFVNVGLAPISPTPQAIITGLVTDESNGNPIAGGKIHFIPALGPGPAVIFTTTTNNLGMFEKILPPGVYYVRGEAVGYIPEFYDNVPTIQQAAPVQAVSGTTVFLNIALAPIVPPVFYDLSGNVSDSLGNPLRAMVSVYPVRNNSHITANTNSCPTDSLGNYSIRVKAGDTVVVYCRPRNPDFFPEFFNNKRTFADADRIFIDGNITGINFVLEHKPVFDNGISGTVMDTAGNGVMSNVTAFPKLLVTPAVMPPHRVYNTFTDSLGNYIITNMIPGQYILLANPVMGFKPTFFRYDGMPTMNRREADSVVVTASGVVQNINFVVRVINSNGFADIAGFVRDNSGKKINGAYILLYDNQQQIYSFAISDRNGKFKIEGVTPGAYTIAADRMGYTSNQSFDVTVDYLNNSSSSVTFTLFPEGLTSVGNNSGQVKEFKLYQNYPNPFNPSTSIKYSIPERTNVKLSVYNILGSEVANLINETKNAGEYEVEFDGSKLPSGVYLYKIEAGGYKAMKKLILMK